GFEWRTAQLVGDRTINAYCLPTVGQTSAATTATSSFTRQDTSNDEALIAENLQHLQQQLQQAAQDAHFTALTVKAPLWFQAQQKLCADYPFVLMSFDELLLRHIQQ